jgi:hypothetical protein
MKKSCLIFIGTIILTFEIHGQSIEKVKDNLVTKIKGMIIDSSWTIKESPDLIELTYIDTFFINSVLGPLNNTNGWHNKLDTLFIKIMFEEKWSQRKLNGLRRKQEKTLEPLIEKYIAHYDSLKWRNIKSNKEIFLTRPVSYLKHWDGLTNDEKLSLRKIIRLPDAVIRGIGIFINAKYKPCGSYIEPQKVYDKVESSYQLFSEIFRTISLYKCEPIYK